MNEGLGISVLGWQANVYLRAGGLCFPLRATARAVAVLRVCGACQGLCMALCALQREPLL